MMRPVNAAAASTLCLVLRKRPSSSSSSSLRKISASRKYYKSVQLSSSLAFHSSCNALRNLNDEDGVFYSGHHPDYVVDQGNPLYIENWDEFVREQNRGMGVAGKMKKYNHLDALPDFGDLRVLRTKMDITKAESDMEKSAIMVIADVEEKEIVLVGLIDDQGTYTSVGYHYLREFDEYRWEIEEAKKINNNDNNKPSDKTLEAYKEYMPIFEKWHREEFIPRYNSNNRSRINN